MRSLQVVKGIPDDEELAAVAAALLLFAGRRAAGTRQSVAGDVAAMSGWRRALRGAGSMPTDGPTTGGTAWCESSRRR